MEKPSQRNVWKYWCISPLALNPPYLPLFLWDRCYVREMTSFTANLEEFKAYAKKLAEATKAPACICLIGDLGAGKTEFARAFIRAKAGEVTVASPTFNIVQVYDNIQHFDLYRLKSAEELQEIGLEDALQTSICLIEWPQIAESLLPKDRTIIKLEVLDSDTRRITVSE